MALKEFLREYGIFESDFPPIAGQYEGRNLIICGDAACVWDDLERFGCRDDSGQGKVSKPGWDIMTINKIVEVLPAEINHCYSNSAGCLRRFIAARRDEYTVEFLGPMHRHAITAGAEHVWPFGGHATSGLGACLVGVALGYHRNVLCGVPLDDGPHNGEPPWRRTAFASSEAAGSVTTDRNHHWDLAKRLAFEGKVRSMSGRTRKWLGDALEWA